MEGSDSQRSSASPQPRPSWDEYFMSIASIVSTRSPSLRLRVGCLLVRDNRIVAQGYNGFLPGLPHESIMQDGHEINTVHAEQNAVADCARRGVTCAGATAYVTHSPCIHCTKMMLAAGIARVRFGEPYRWDPQSERLCRLARVPLEAACPCSEQQASHDECRSAPQDDEECPRD